MLKVKKFLLIITLNHLKNFLLRKQNRQQHKKLKIMNKIIHKYKQHLRYLNLIFNAEKSELV